MSAPDTLIVMRAGDNVNMSIYKADSMDYWPPDDIPTLADISIDVDECTSAMPVVTRYDDRVLV